MSYDPTKTTTLRRRYEREVRRRVRLLQQAINRLIITDDEFGLIANVNRYKFLTDSGKVDAFRTWLTEQCNNKILGNGVGRSAPWTHKYTDSAYRRGVVSAYEQTRKLVAIEAGDKFTGGKEEFLRSTFAASETTQKLELLYTRTFDAFAGFNAAMAEQTSRILAGGLADGWGPRKIAREMVSVIGKLTRKRALVIARTETIRAHAEGQLDSFDELGVKKLGIKAEWTTAGDDRVCPICSPFEGTTYTIKQARGLIPAHPNCRCSFTTTSIR